MRARLLQAALGAAAMMAAALLFAGLALTTRQRVLDTVPGTEAVVTGAFHVHTNRSDGSGTPDEIAEAASRAGLQFLIFADHGDGTVAAEPPQYRAGVLCLDAVEISTAAGHYIAVGFSPAPYRLGGEPRDVIEDVSRLGGFGIVAHPESPKPALRWNEWTAAFDAVEWLNADSEWRDERKRTLARALLGYPVRPVATVASLLDRPGAMLHRWDVLTERRRVVSIAGIDAHGRVGLGRDDADTPINGWFLRLPSYAVAFRAFTTRVILDRPWSGDAAADATALIRSLRAGQSYTSIDALATPPFLDFSANTRQTSARQGGLLQSGAPLELSVRTNAPADSIIRVIRNGSIVKSSTGSDLRLSQAPEPGVFRVEVTLATAPGDPPVPWLLSNPIWVEPPGWASPTLSARAAAADSLALGSEGWHVEADASSSGEIIQTSEEWLGGFRFRLGSADRGGRYAALAVSVGSALAGRDRVSFRARASQPMRVSVQARRAVVGERWHRSVYLDAQPRELVIFFDDMRPIGPTSTFRFDPAQVDTLLFVVDPVNARPGMAGMFLLGTLALQR